MSKTQNPVILAAMVERARELQTIRTLHELSMREEVDAKRFEIDNPGAAEELAELLADPAVLGAMVDRLAAIKAQTAELSSAEKSIKNLLTESGLPAVEGTAHRAAISHCSGRETVDWAAIAAKFEPSRQLIKAHTATGAPFVVVRVSARRGV